MKKVDSIAEFDQLVDRGEPFYFIKHSLTCPISQAAFDEYNKFKQHCEIPCYYLAVQEARELSNHIAEQFHVKHESPQAFLFNNSEVSWHASHRKITEQSLKTAYDEKE